jgi:hypothetical protein
MNTYNFSLVISQPTMNFDEAADKLFEAGCDDGTFGISNGLYEIEFDREANSFEEAIRSAISDVKKAKIGSRILRVTPDDLVNANEIAERSGKTRQAVALWRHGERGSGFPPIKAIVGKSPVWSWFFVSKWLCERGDIAQAVVESAKVIAQIDHEIEISSEC